MSNILIVDDEPLIRWSLAETFHQGGHKTREARDAAEALELLSEPDYVPDAVLLDYRLPDSDDLQLLTNVCRIVPASVVLMMTAFLPADVAAQARRIGARMVMSKPVDLQEVVNLVERLIPQANPIR